MKSQFTQQELEQALRKCAEEPIHQIGKVQPHGAMLVFSSTCPHRVLQASNNLMDFLGLSATHAIDKPLAAIIGARANVQVQQLIQKLADRANVIGVLNIDDAQKEKTLHAHLFCTMDLFVLELEPKEEHFPETNLAPQLLDLQQSMEKAESDPVTSRYFDQIATLVQELTAYDSVMVYRFDAHWHGEVISQSRVEHAPSYLGLHFPASDIPAQARQLYTLNLVRIVADVDANPVDLFPEINPHTQQPLDMTFSALRSLSPIHIQYLRNMGVQASMVISLLQNGRLWGLIACHHHTPKPVSLAMREAATFISRLVSTRLAAIEAQERLTQFERAHAIISELANHIAHESVEVVIQTLLPRLKSLLAGTGIIMIADGKRYTCGDVPNPAELDQLMTWLGSHTASKLFCSDHLEQHYSPANGYRDIASGLLATSLSSDMSNCIIWLRKEKTRTVNWAGSAEKSLSLDASGTVFLTPRNSFEIWTEAWLGRSASWGQIELDIAQSLALTLPESLGHKYRLEQAQIQQKRAETEAIKIRQQLESMTATVPGVVYQLRVSVTGEVQFVHLSRGIQTLYEISAAAAYRNPALITDCILPEDQESHRLSFERAVVALTVWEHEHRIKTPGGIIKWIQGMATPQPMQDGSILWNGLLTDVSERKKNEAALIESELRFRSLANAAPVLIWVAEADKSCSWFNDTWLEYTGRSLEEELGFGWSARVHPTDLPTCLETYNTHFDARKSFQMEYRLRGKDGAYHWFIDVGKPRLDRQGQFLGYIGMLTDISERKKLERITHFRQFSLDHAGEEVFWIGQDGSIKDANKLACAKVGYSHAELCSLTVSDIDPTFPEDKWPEHWQQLKQTGSLRFQSLHKNRDGIIFPTEVVANYFEYEGEEYNCALVRDISEHMKLLHELDQQAKSDFLTGLVNRRYFLELAEQELARCQRYGNPLSILMLDIDLFKTINDTYGHKAGDLVLIKLAEVCKDILREVDVIGRFGGEEFAIFLPETRGPRAREVAERICQALRSATVTLEKSELEIHFTVSIGVATMTTVSNSVDELLQEADAALYQAKNGGRNQVFPQCLD